MQKICSTFTYRQKLFHVSPVPQRLLCKFFDDSPSLQDMIN